MVQNRITTIGDSAALLLSPDILNALNIHIGDEVDIALIDQMLITGVYQSWGEQVTVTGPHVGEAAFIEVGPVTVTYPTPQPNMHPLLLAP